MQAVREIGLRQVIRFFFTTLFIASFNLLLFPPLRSWALQLMGARIGKGTVIHAIRFFNAYRTGFQGLKVGDKCFIGDECLIDLADKITLEDEVTLAERVIILTHTKVGYADHPLQRFFPPFSAPVHFKRGAFVGVNSTIMPGVTIGEGTLIAAGSVVTKDTPNWVVMAGVPARIQREIKSDSMEDYS